MSVRHLANVLLALGALAGLAPATPAAAQCILKPGQERTVACRDSVPPWIGMTPESGASSTREHTAEILWNDESYTQEPVITLNGTTVSPHFTTKTWFGPVVDVDYGQHGSATATFQLEAGDNVLTASVCDDKGRCSTATATYTVAAGPPTPPLQATGGLASPARLPSHEEVVSAAFRQVLLREPSGSELKAWRDALSNLQSGTSVHHLLRKIAPSAEFLSRFVTPFDARTAAGHVYQRVMGREPTQAEGDALIARASSSGWTAAIEGVLQSSAFLNRYGRNAVPGPGQHVRYFDPIRPGVVLDGMSIAPVREGCLAVPAAPGATSQCGDLVLTHSLQPVIVGGRSYSASLLYNSQHAYPMPSVGAWVVPHPLDVAPSRVTAVLMVGVAGAERVERARWNWTGSDWPAGEARRIALTFADATLPTGSHPIVVETTVAYPDGRTVSYSVEGSLPVVNRARSPYGQGWSAGGVDQLIHVDASTILRVTDAGSVHTLYASYTRPNVWVDASFDRADTLTFDPQRQVYTRRLPDGARVEYQNGVQTAVIDRAAQRVTFEYATVPNFGRALVRIVTPLTDRDLRLHLNENTGILFAATRWAGGAGQQVGAYHIVDGRLFHHWDYSSGRDLVYFTYDDLGRVVTRKDRDTGGTLTTFSYDAVGKLASAAVDMQGTGKNSTATFTSQHARGHASPVRATEVYTVIDGPRTDIVDQTRVQLDALGAPVRVRNAFNQLSTVDRADARYPALVTRTAGTDGVTARTWYDALGRVDSTRVDNPLGDGRHAVTRYAYDAVWPFFPVQAVGPDGVVHQAGYDAATGNRVWAQVGTDASRRVYFDYLATGVEAGQLHRIRSPLPQGQVATTTFGYDAAGNPRLSIDAAGLYRLTDRDVWGRPVDTYTPISVARGTTEENVRAYGVRQTVFYNKAGEDTMRLTRAPSVAIPWMYGTWATRTAVPAEGHIVEKKRDAFGRVTEVARWVWTGEDSNELARPPLDVVLTGYRYDAAGRLTQVKEGTDSATIYEYDAAGNMVASTNGNGHTVRSVYDALGRVVRRTTPAVTHQKECLPAVVETPGFPSDCNRPEARFPFFPNDFGGAYVVGEDVATYWYDDAGRLTAADNRDARIRRSYLPSGLLRTDSVQIRGAGGAGFSSAHTYGISYAYDLAGRLVSLTHPSNLAGTGSRDTLAYNAATGALEQLTSRTGVSFAYQYDVAGRLSVRSSSAGTDSLYYDALGQLTRHRGPVFNETMQYDARGKNVWRQDATGRQFFNHFSGLGALVGTEWRRRPTGGLEMEEFSTDPLGHTLWRRRANDLDSGYHAEDSLAHAANSGRVHHLWSARPREWLGNDDRFEFTKPFYDQAGNTRWSRHLRQTRDPYNRVERAYYHSGDNRLAAVQTLNEMGLSFTGERRGSFEEHRYDALGRRVLKRTRRGGLCFTQSPEVVDCASVVERFVWAGDDLLWETRSDDAQPSTFGPEYGAVGYTHGGGTDRPLVISKGSDVVIPQASWRGSFGAGIDVAGNASSQIQWPAFNSTAWHGQIMANAPSKLWFGSLVGEMRDVSGLMFRRARYYDPQLGQFTQSDPIGVAGGLNTYGFGAGDPVSNGDPSGMAPESNGGCEAGDYRCYNPVRLSPLSSAGDCFSCRIDRWFDGLINEAPRGAASYPRGLYRFGRHVARRYGALGRCEQERVVMEDRLLQEVAARLARSPEAREVAVDAAAKYVRDNPFRFAGRAGVGILVTKAVGPAGFLISSGAVYGDLRFAVERGRATIEDLAAAAVGGSVAASLMPSCN